MDRSTAGSSPHTRGTRIGGRPSYARRTVHPRIRGEHSRVLAQYDGTYGSSPHTRGTPTRERFGRPRRRFIPAYAGNTLGGVVLGHVIPVHPRIRGEHHPVVGAQPGSVGSSPHTRGTRRCGAEGLPVHRFIPAYAGNTVIGYLNLPSMTVHPRIRGEHSFVSMCRTSAVGSSPHTRGTRLRSGKNSGQPRFIPAYAGNTVSRLALARGESVHPRIRGEHGVNEGPVSAENGSSPHTRGTHFP